MPRHAPIRPSTDSTATTMIAPPSRASSTYRSTTSAPVKIPSTFTDGLPLPKLMVFDLDYTLWPFWVDTHVTPPLKAMEGGAKVRDRGGEGFGFYDDVPGILGALRQLSILVAAASRTCAPDLAREMLRLLKIDSKPPIPASSTDDSDGLAALPTSPTMATSGGKNPTKAYDYFDHLQIYPGSKIRHFEQLAKDTGLPYEEMLFFDDESRNKEVEKLGVVMKLVRDGVTVGEVDKGVADWRRRNRRG